MHPSNPANVECKYNVFKLHYWHFHRDGSATCALCLLQLTKIDAEELKVRQSK